MLSEVVYALSTCYLFIFYFSWQLLVKLLVNQFMYRDLMIIQSGYLPLHCHVSCNVIQINVDHDASFLQISSFRESKSDDRRFYIFTARKTLHLRTDSKRDRVAWIQALVSTSSLFLSRSLGDAFSCIPPKVSISTEKLKKRLAQEGVGENAVKDCEYIMLSEFSEIQGQLKLLCEERSNLLDTLRQLVVCSQYCKNFAI